MAGDEGALSSEADYSDWDKLAEHAQTLDGLTELERERASRAFRSLKVELGVSFLVQAVAQRHPLVAQLFNLAPWTRRWIVWFADALNELKRHENYSSILSRLRDPRRFSEGWSVLSTAYKFVLVGFRITIDPQVTVSTGEKVPDVKITNEGNGEELYVEISIQKTAVSEREAQDTTDRIIQPLWRTMPFLHYCGRIRKTLAPKHLQEVVRRVERIAQEAMQEEAFRELVIDGVLELGVSPDSDKEMLTKWAAARELRVGEFSGPSFDVDEVLRTRKKLEREQQQLPRDRANIVVIFNNRIFTHSQDVRGIITEIEEEVYRYPHVLATVITGGHLGSGDDLVMMKDQHVYIQRTNVGLLVEQYLVLLNRFCEVKVLPQTITQIYQAFRGPLEA